jgi:hypothetical protein
MKTWFPGMRDKAIDGLSTLARRADWRSSRYGEAIAARIQDSLDDENPVVRMSAAQAIGSLHTHLDAAERVRLIGDRLNDESNANVQDVLLSALAPDVNEAPQVVDHVLRDFVAKSTTVTGAAESDEDQRDLVVDMLTLLAVTQQTPFALSSIEQWAASAPRFSAEAQRAVQFLSDYIAPETEPDLQRRAFQLLAAAADAALRRWTANPKEHLDEVNLSAEETAELQGALHIADNVADQIYFASEASHNGDDDVAALGSSHSQFATLAFPVLATCARTKVAPIVHRVVETFIYLGPLDEKRTLLAVADAVAGDYGYAGDPLAGATVIPYLKRLLADHRQLVLFDEQGVAAFRHLLSAFASAGNESALEMAFTFADVFR